MGTRSFHRGSHERTFFVYDHQKHNEEDDPKDAILYFYPPSVDIQEQIALVGGIIGTVDFCMEVLQHTPSLISLTSCKFALLKSGPFILGLSSELSAPEQYVTHYLQYLWNTFCLFQGSLVAVKQRTGKDGFTLELERIWTSYFSLCQSFSDCLSQAFRVIPYRELSVSQSSVFLAASHILQRTQLESGVIGGVLLNKNRVLCTQLSPDITRRLLLLMPHERNFPCIELKPEFDLPAGVRLLYAFLTPEELSALGPRKLAKSHHKVGQRQAAEASLSSIASVTDTNFASLQVNALGKKSPDALSAVTEYAEGFGEEGYGEDCQDDDQSDLMFHSLDSSAAFGKVDEETLVAADETLKAESHLELNNAQRSYSTDVGTTDDGKECKNQLSLLDNAPLSKAPEANFDWSSFDECGGKTHVVVAEIHRNDSCSERTELPDRETVTAEHHKEDSTMDTIYTAEHHKEDSTMDTIYNENEVKETRRNSSGDVSPAEDGGTETPSVNHYPDSKVVNKELGQCHAGDAEFSRSIPSDSNCQANKSDGGESPKDILHKMGPKHVPSVDSVMVNGVSDSDVDVLSSIDLVKAPDLGGDPTLRETEDSGDGNCHTDSVHSGQSEGNVEQSEKGSFNVIQTGSGKFVDESVTLLSSAGGISTGTEIQQCINRLTDAAAKYLSLSADDDGNSYLVASATESDSVTEPENSTLRKTVSDVSRNDAAVGFHNEHPPRTDSPHSLPQGDSQEASSPVAQVVHFDSTPAVIGQAVSDLGMSVPTDSDLRLDFSRSTTNSALTVSDDILSPSKERICFENTMLTSGSSSSASVTQAKVKLRHKRLRERSTEHSSSDMAHSTDNLSAPFSSSSTLLSSPSAVLAGKKRGQDLGLEGRREVMLYVQGHMDTLLVLVMEDMSHATKDRVNFLWKSSLAKLAELDFSVSDTMGSALDDVNGPSSYLYLKYNSSSQAMEGTGIAPVTSLANELVSSSVLLHDTFSAMPAAQDILCKTHTTCCYGHKTICSETFFQVMASKGGGFPDPRDIAFSLDQYADKKLYMDHGTGLM